MFVLLLLVHHSSVLSAGHAAVSGSHAIAVLGDMGVGGEKIMSTVLALTGGMSVVQAVHQIEDVKMNQGGELYALDKHHVCFMFGIAGKVISGGYGRGDGEGLNLCIGELLHHGPEVLAVETVVGSGGEEGLVAFLEPAQILNLEV